MTHADDWISVTKRALITGITGQAGSYLAELLLAKGSGGHGPIRRSSSFNTGRIDHVYESPQDPERQLTLHHGDLHDGAGLVSLLSRVQPDEVYHLGAQSHVRVSFDMPVYTGDVTGLATVQLLEAIRCVGLDTRFYQASSSEMFGATSRRRTRRRTSTRGRPTGSRRSTATGSRATTARRTGCSR